MAKFDSIEDLVQDLDYSRNYYRKPIDEIVAKLSNPDNKRPSYDLSWAGDLHGAAATIEVINVVFGWIDEYKESGVSLSMDAVLDKLASYAYQRLMNGIDEDNSTSAMHNSAARAMTKAWAKMHKYLRGDTFSGL